MQEFLKTLSDNAENVSCSKIVFESHSTIAGNQVRVDIVFETEAESRNFNIKVNESKSLPQGLIKTTFLFSEAEMNFNQGPVLTEIDILHIVKFDRLRNLFRHLLPCSVVMEDGNNIVFRFNSVADVNLFLYNKCRNSNKRILGKFRQNQEQLQLLPGRDGKFSLKVNHVRKESDSWEVKFKFKQKVLEGVNHFQFEFENKLDLYTFFASEEAKNCDIVEVPREQLIDHEESLETYLAEEKDTWNQIVSIDKKLAAAKVELAKKETEFHNQKKLITELRKELQVKLSNNTS